MRESRHAFSNGWWRKSASVFFVLVFFLKPSSLCRDFFEARLFLKKKRNPLKCFKMRASYQSDTSDVLFVEVKQSVGLCVSEGAHGFPVLGVKMSSFKSVTEH